MKPIFFNMIKGGAVGVYCTACKTHWTLGDSTPEKVSGSIFGELYCYTEYETKTIWDELYVEDSVTTIRCKYCGNTHENNSEKNMLEKVFIDGPKVKLSVIHLKPTILLSKSNGAQILVTKEIKKRLTFNTVTRRVYFLDSKSKNPIVDASYIPSDIWNQFYGISADLIKELKAALDIHDEDINNLRDIMLFFKFGDVDTGKKLLRSADLFKKRKRWMIIPHEILVKESKFHLAPKSVKKIVGLDREALMFYIHLTQGMQIDNSVKILKCLVDYNDYKRTVDRNGVGMHNLVDLKTLISLAPNETDIVNKVVKALALSVVLSEEVSDNNGRYDYAQQYKYRPLDYITDIVRNLDDIASSVDLETSYRGTTIKKYLYKGSFLEIHDKSSIVRKLFVDNQRALPEYPERNITINDVSFISPTNEKEIVEVGSKMHICVGGYAREIMNKSTSVVYALDAESIAFACLEIRDKTVNQLKGFGNHMVTESRDECLAYIKFLGFKVGTNLVDVSPKEVEAINLSKFTIEAGITKQLAIPERNVDALVADNDFPF